MRDCDDCGETGCGFNRVVRDSVIYWVCDDCMTPEERGDDGFADGMETPSPNRTGYHDPPRDAADRLGYWIENAVTGSDRDALRAAAIQVIHDLRGLQAAYETSHASRLHAEKALERVEAELGAAQSALLDCQRYVLDNEIDFARAKITTRVAQALK